MSDRNADHLVIRLFGPLSFAVSDGRRLRLPGGRQQALLALLASAPDMRRHRSWLIDKLWSDSAPDRGRANLRQLLHATRQSLGAEFSDPFDVASDSVSLRPRRVRLAGGPRDGELLEGFDLSQEGFEDFPARRRAVARGCPALRPSLQAAPTIPASAMGLLTARDGIVGPWRGPAMPPARAAAAEGNLRAWPDWCRQVVLGNEVLSRLTYSHGTHVLDLAAGMDPEDPEGARYPIIAVTLPPEVTRETSGSMLTLPVALGLEYILDRARRLVPANADPPRVVINFSFGLTGGPRLGRHPLEKTVQRLAQRHRALSGSDRPPVVVVPAGNRNLAGGHAQSAPGAAALSVTWHIQPADPTSNVLEIRVQAAPGAVETLELGLTPPGQAGPTVARLSVAGDDAPFGPQLLRRNHALIGSASVADAGGGVTLLTLALAPSDPGLTDEPAAAAGDWRVTVAVPGLTPERIDATVLRDDVPHGFRDNGRQSYFTDPGHVEHDPQGRIVADDPEDAAAGIRRAGTLNAIATGARSDGALRVTGAFVGSADMGPLRAADYSAAPSEGGAEHVDVSARGDRSRALPGVLAAGTRSGTRGRINGTSVAAPQITRHLAMGDGRLAPTPDDLPRHRLGPLILVSEGDEEPSQALARCLR